MKGSVLRNNYVLIVCVEILFARSILPRKKTRAGLEAQAQVKSCNIQTWQQAALQRLQSWLTWEIWSLASSGGGTKTAALPGSTMQPQKVLSIVPLHLGEVCSLLKYHQAF